MIVPKLQAYEFRLNECDPDLCVIVSRSEAGNTDAQFAARAKSSRRIDWYQEIECEASSVLRRNGQWFAACVAIWRLSASSYL